MPKKKIEERVTGPDGLRQCPGCGRFFARQNQSHSCTVYSADDHFRGRPEYLRQTFDYLLPRLKLFGPVRTDAVKSAINISGHYHFIMLYVLKNALNIEFARDRKIDNERIFRTEKLSESRYTYYVKVSGKAGIDDQLLGWLEESYNLTAS